MRVSKNWQYEYIQWYKGHTKEIQRRYKGDTKAIQRQYKGDTKDIQRTYKEIIQRTYKETIQRRYKGDTKEDTKRQNNTIAIIALGFLATINFLIPPLIHASVNISVICIEV